jgi:hypothetical protein
MPPANTWWPRCRYWAKLEGISFPEQTEELAPPGKSVALKETPRRGPPGTSTSGYGPITASRRALFPRPSIDGTAGERSL